MTLASITPRTCRTCAVFSRDEDPSRGACRRKSPTVFLVGSQMGRPTPLACFAPVQADWWCGEWSDAESLNPSTEH